MDYMIAVLCAVPVFYRGGASLFMYNVTDADRLYTNLTTGYNKVNRPADPVSVTIGLSVNSINTLDVKQQVFSITGHFSMKWSDFRLTWPREDFKALPFIYLPEADLWRPEIVIENAAKSLPIITNDQLALKVIGETGTVLWNPPGVFVVNCDIDVTYYPFDTQVCYVIISTWSHDAGRIRMVTLKQAISFRQFQENGEWTLLDSYIEDVQVELNDEDLSKEKLSFVFKLKRRIGYYIINMIIPPMLTSFLGLVVFLLPADSGEKVGFSITVLLALAVLLTIATEYIPSTSNDTSVYGVYLVCNLFVSALEVLLTNVVLQLHHRTDDEVPHRLQRFAKLFLARTSCHKTCRRTITSRSTSEVMQLPRRSQVGANVSPEKVNESGNATTRSARNSVADSEELDDEMGYTWVEIAAMVDRTAFYVISVILISISVVFTAVLVLN